MKKLTNVLYFHDCGDEPEPEIRQFQRKFYNKGFEVSFVDEVDVPPFKGASNEKSYDILLFDYGGMMIGNDLMSHFCKYILREANECPNRIYIMVSTFTTEAMREAQTDFQNANEGKLPFNVFLSIEEACEHLNKLEV